MWYKQKTTATLIAGALAAIASYLTGEISLTVCIASCLAALSGIFMRQGIEKSSVLNQQNIDKVCSNIETKLESIK